MAWSAPVETREFSASISGTPITFSPAATIPVGTLIYIYVAVNNSITYTCSDNSTQPGAANSYVISAVDSGTTLTGCAIYCLATTREILATDVVTVTCSVASSRRNGKLWTYVPPGITPVLDKSSTAPNVASSPATFASTGALTETGELAIASIAYRSGSASGFSVPAGYSSAGTYAGSGGTVTWIEADPVYKANAGTAAEAPVVTMANPPASALGRLLVFRSSPPPPKQIHIVSRTPSGA